MTKKKKGGLMSPFFIFIYMSNQKIEQLKEYAKIIKDTPYALKTYLQTQHTHDSSYPG